VRINSVTATKPPRLTRAPKATSTASKTTNLLLTRDHPQQPSGCRLPRRGGRSAEPRLDPLLDGDDELEDALQQDRREQGEGEGLADHLGEVLDEEVEDDHVHEDVDNRRGDARVDELSGVSIAVGHLVDRGPPPIGGGAVACHAAAGC
jgi:hypothetical protein